MAARACSHSRQVTYNALSSFCKPANDVPTYLAPCTQFAKRSFSNTPLKHSKIGRASLSVPSDVTFEIITPSSESNVSRMAQEPLERMVEITGPLGKMSMTIPSYVSITTAGDEGNTRQVSIEDTDNRKQRAMWGTVRAYLNNHILGVSEGHTAILRLVGVGYRATIEDTAITKSPEYPGQKFVSLKAGYSHPIELGVPPGVKASTPQPTRILLEGVEKETVMQFAARIRAWRKPEPYKGKGIFVNGETIKLKAKKIK